MSLAAVFDSAGTLMKTVRAVFSVKEQAIRHDAETTLLVFEDKDRSLVLLNAGYTDIFRRTEDLPLSAWIAEQNINGRLPKLPDNCTPQSVKVLSSGYVMDNDTKTARYQIQCQLIYIKTQEVQ